jgi:hypothetical protein
LRLDTLASKLITLLEGGKIRSHNYVPGVSGFEVDSSGNAEFNNISIMNDSVFAGDIISGPLELNSVCL